MRILALGDIVGRPGRQVLAEKLPALIREHKPDLVIANGENIAGGSGITANLFTKLRHYGVDVVTLGDHCFKRNDIYETLARSERILRPANLSRHAAGRGSTIVQTEGGARVGVVVVLGRVLVPTMQADDPFAAVDGVLAEWRQQKVAVAVVEVHAEATGEKAALGHYVDGRAALVFGTHTHVPTADARLLPGGTAYITDLGMCGPYDSVLGRRKDAVMRAMTTNMPQPYDVATNDVRLCGVLAEVDQNTGRATAIQRIEVQGANVTQAYDTDDRNGASA